MTTFTRLVRVEAEGHSKPVYADAILPSGVTDIGKAKQARIVGSDIWKGGQVTESIVNIKRFLQPIAPGAVGTVRCLGLNYREHAIESKMPIPQYPILFYKPPTALAGPFDDIVVPPVAQQAMGVDYECELVAVIGKEGINIPESRALEHILGYTVGNDVSHREWQLHRSGGQWAMGKGFDTWAPYGPGIVSSHFVEDPSNLTISTKVNGEVVQRSNTCDLIFSVAQTVSFLSQGTTLKPGDMIWTGTPQGVGMGRTPQLWLKDGDIVEVSLDAVGTCVNKVRFTKNEARL